MHDSGACKLLMLHTVVRVPPSHWYHSKSSWYSGKHYPRNTCEWFCLLLL